MKINTYKMRTLKHEDFCADGKTFQLKKYYKGKRIISKIIGGCNCKLQKDKNLKLNI